ncbi:hypothetical protein BDP81DRAFT_465791 [Colletotrichum phormii]|uniref:Uncharacterized protein n=1 Tax=Colletotrichum phormii TaxID=359342 RepID=A0AAI9ZE14_9PEZI|nr:uncharacterized protein BDP81DRAFT_465791 [Colletotrichum phormii]KAK1622721.1 hypothetical protein BDP81DRAFT_465791 [Colletotrichum phormii]
MRPDVALYNGIAPDGTLQYYTTTRGGSNEFLVHGIRHHESFAKSPEVNEVCKVHDRHARARNARLIMSNIIPDMASQAVIPYCIWYPDVATEDTYRELFYRHPEMRYHIGRACAVAGYRQLYNELDLLPDVSIAEEACDNGALDIFEHIVSQPLRFAVMNDYQRSVDLQNPRPGACLNGDTAIRSSLQRHQPSRKDGGAPEKEPNLKGEHIDLLHNPLPRDLPPINKDILVLMAAWDGNIDRYARLRRPVTVPNEITAFVRGAYHHTPFARWLETCAYHARFIMNDDLSRIDSEVDGETLPEFFWWPHSPHENTLRELTWRRPDLKHQVTLACIAGNHEDIFHELSDGTKPTQEQWEAALQSRRKFYLENIERRAKEEDLEFCDRYDWIQEYLRPTNEFYRGYDELAVIKEISNEPDDHSEDWDDWYQPEDNLFNYHMHLQMLVSNNLDDSGPSTLALHYVDVVQSQIVQTRTMPAQHIYQITAFAFEPLEDQGFEVGSMQHGEIPEVD